MGFSSPATGNGSAAPSLPPIQTVVERPSEESQDHQMQKERAPQNGAGGTTATSGGGGTFQLPPFSFDTNTTSVSNLPPARDTSSLSPITERTDSHSLSRGSTQEQSHISPATSLSARGATKQATIEEEAPNILGTRRVESPPPLDGSNDQPQQPQQQRQISATSPPMRPAQLAPRFSQDSGAGLGSGTVSASASLSASGSGSGSGSVGVKGARSPPLSPESSISRYSQPEDSMYSNPNTHITGPEQPQSAASTSTLQSPVPGPERDMPQSSPPSSFASQMQRQFGSPMSSVPPRMQQLHQQQHQQYQNDPVPPTPASMFSTSTHMSSPFSINELNKEQPPAPPEKAFQRTQMQNQQRQQWEPQYKHRGADSEYVFDEPGALYLMQQHRQAEASQQQGPSPRRSEDRDEDEYSDDSHRSALTNPLSVRSGAPLQFTGARATPPPRATPSPGTSPSPSSPRVPVSPVPRRHAPGGFEVVSGAVGTAALATVSGGASVRSGRSGSLPDTGSYTATSPTLGGTFPGGSVSGSGNVGTSPGLAAENGSGSRGLGRRPSGARAPQQPQSRVAGGKRFVPTDSPSSLPREADEDVHSLSFPPPPSGPFPQAQRTPSQTTSPQPSQFGSPHYYGRQVHSQMASSLVDDETVDALAALSFLEQQDALPSNEPAARATSPQDEKTREQRSPPPMGSSSLPPPPTIMEPEDRAPSPLSEQPSNKPYRSSFAPSKQAAERKARSAAQQAAHEEILHKPGRPNGKQRAKQREGGWESSEDEEEEDDEDEDDDVNTDDEAHRTSSRGPPSGTSSIAAPVGRNPMVQQQMRGLSPSNSTSEEFKDHQSQQRSVRTLPQIPQRGRSPAGTLSKFYSY